MEHKQLRVERFLRDLKFVERVLMRLVPLRPLAYFFEAELIRIEREERA